VATAPDPEPTAAPEGPRQVVVISHSPIFYWWPVWLAGFVMAALTYYDGYQMALVPVGTVAERSRVVDGHDGPRDVLVLPANSTLPGDPDTGGPDQPRLRMAASNNLGVVWATVLCMVVVITHIHLRGLWSVIIIMTVVFAVVLLAVLGWWDPILRAVSVIDIHINAFGYLSISLFLFVIWLVTYLVYDRQVYMIFTRGQLRVRHAIGGGEKVYDTRGMVVEKHRGDVFRHWLLGFGSGDLTVRTAGTMSEEFAMSNVLGIDRKLALINTMVQEREVIQGTA